MAVLLKVKDWDKHFENNRTRELKHMDWVPIPNKMDGDGYTELVDHPDGAAHLGAWLAIVEVASKCDPRGTLLRDGAEPHDSASLTRITRLPRGVFDAVIPRLIAIGWLTSEVVESSTFTTIPQEGAGIPQEGAPSRARAERKGTEGNGREMNTLSASADAGDGDTPRGIDPPQGNGSPKPADAPKARTRGKGKAPAKPEHGAFKSHFTHGWKARYGADYAWVSGKDDAHAKWILDRPGVDRDAEKAKAIADAYLANDDPWIIERRHALGLLVSGFNRFSTSAPEVDDCPFPVNYNPGKEITDLADPPQPVYGRPIE